MVNRKALVRVFICLSAAANILLAFMLLYVTNYSDDAPLASAPPADEQMESAQYTGNQSEATPESRLERIEEAVQMLLTMYARDQLFFGKWEVAEWIPPETLFPSSIYGLDGQGKRRGPDIFNIIGREITFAEDYAEFAGEKHFYFHKPETYTYAVFSDEQHISLNYAKTLGITGNYYSIIYFLLPGNYLVAGYEEYVHEIRLDDLCTLYLKDNNTMFASNGRMLYRLERMG